MPANTSADPQDSLLSVRHSSAAGFLAALVLLFVVQSVAQARTLVNLNGSWQYQIATNIAYPPPTNWVNTTVPDTITSSNYAKAWFRKTFSLPILPSNHRVKLRFGGVKYRATVYLNGQNIGGCYNGYDPFELDATTAAVGGGINELLVSVTDWTGLFSSNVDFSNLAAGESARDRANDVVLAPIGGHFNRFGLWDGVTIEYTPAVNLQDVFLMPSVRQQRLTVRSKVRNDTAGAVSATLNHRITDGTNTVLLLPSQTVNLGPGQIVELETSTNWSAPRLWCPEDPFLYRAESTVSSAGVSPDTVTNRFGFRELWTVGDSFYLNGTKLHLLAAACWPPTTPTSDSVIRQALIDVKRGNNSALRLHTQPWPAAWYHLADEVGLMLVEEAAVWCDPRAYRLSDPVFWTNYADHLRAMVRRDANHPSIIMWSLENEILHCGGDRIFAGSTTNLAQLGILVKTLDPTRPITFEADLDPGGVADVVGLHYPHEFPDNAYWPNTAYWMDQPISKSYWPGGKWQWDRSKPLYIGEYLWVPDTAPEGLSILFGDEAYFDRSHYRQLAKAWTWQMQIEAYRSYEVSAHCPWTMVEDPAASGLVNLNTNQNRLYKLQAAAYHPNAVVVHEYDTRFFTGENVGRTLTVYNDTPSNGNFVLEWRINGAAAGSRSFALAPAGKRVENVSFNTPATPGLFNLELILSRQGAAKFSNSIVCSAAARSSLTATPGRRYAIYDPAGLTMSQLSGIEVFTVTNLTSVDYSSFDFLVVGRHALRPETIPTIGNGTIAAQWQRFAETGGWILVLEQTNYPSWMPLGLSLVSETASFAFPVPGHPLVAGLSDADLRWWRGNNAVTKAAISIPTRGNFRPVVHVGSRGGLERAGILELPIGRGGVLCCQLLVSERYGVEPVADALFQRLLSHKPEVEPLRYTGLLAEPDSSAAQTLNRLGIASENLLGKIADTDLGRFSTLILAGTNAAWAEAIQSVAALQAYVEAGGKLIVHRPTDAFLAAAPGLLSNVTWSGEVTLPIVRRDNPGAPRRFTNHDLHWADQKGDWNTPEVLSTNIASRVYRKNFNLPTWTTIQVENMPTKTSGGAISGGWGLWANGYVAQNITVTQPGTYLFGVIARGAPLGGIYPHMVLRIDGSFADAVSVTSTNWATFTLIATLTAGTHELALAFDNDAYAPPEDRNLYLDQVRYGLDPLPDSPTFLTRPGAVVQSQRGRGTVTFDEISWETPGIHSVRAERYVASLLTTAGVQASLTPGVRFEAEKMQPVNLAAIGTNNGIVSLNSAGRLQTTAQFTDTGKYVFEITGYGNLVSGSYPIAELLIDGTARGRVELAADAPKTFSIITTVTAGFHTVAVAFVNDLYEPPLDRNMALDAISVRPQLRPKIVDLYLKPGSGKAVVAWLGEPGGTYNVEHAATVSGPWQKVNSLMAQGTVASWTDDGAVIGQPPAGSGRPSGFYRVSF